MPYTADILSVDAQANADGMGQNSEPCEAGAESCLVESFTGFDGLAYEVRRAAPKKKSNKVGGLKNSWGNTRHNFNWDNRGEMGGSRSYDTDVAVAPKFGCIRCGSDSHTWRRCHMAFQKNLDFPNKNGGPPVNTIAVSSNQSGELNLAALHAQKLRRCAIHLIVCLWRPPIITAMRKKWPEYLLQ